MGSRANGAIFLLKMHYFGPVTPVRAGPIESLPLVLSVSEVVVGIVFHPSVKQLLWKTSPRILAKLGTNVQ